MAGGGTAIIIIAAIILIVGAFISLHFWFHVFFVLPPQPETAVVTSTSTSLNNMLYAIAGGPTNWNTLNWTLPHFIWHSMRVKSIVDSDPDELEVRINTHWRQGDNRYLIRSEVKVGDMTLFYAFIHYDEKETTLPASDY